MKKEQLNKKTIPDSPGVYFFLGSKKKILYIGKATSLKNRVNSYFSTDIKEKRSGLIEKMVSESKTIDYTVTDSVLEALLLETNLIRTHKPRYNTKSKDDKSYNHLIITNEEWPRVIVVREKDLNEKYKSSLIKYSFGPFPNGALFKDALKIIRKLFKFYDTKIPVGTEKSKMAKGKIDFNRQIGLYPDPSKREEYLQTVRHLKLFFEGKKHSILKELEKKMVKLAKQEKFEEANLVKKRIFALKHIEDIALIKNSYKSYVNQDLARIEAYDIAHHAGKDMVGVMTVVEGGVTRLNEYRKFNIKTLDKANDSAALKEIVSRRLQHSEWNLPQLIVVDGAMAQKNAVEEVLKTHNLMIPVVAVVKNDKHKPERIIAPKSILEKFELDILLANSESHRFAISFHRKSARRSQLS